MGFLCDILLRQVGLLALAIYFRRGKSDDHLLLLIAFLTTVLIRISYDLCILIIVAILGTAILMFAQKDNSFL